MNNFKSSQAQRDKSNESQFDIKALDLYRLQADENIVYRKYNEFLGIDPASVKSVEQIPFMPIEFFKTHTIKTNDWQEEKVFESSGTTGVYTSRHYVRNVKDYHDNAQRIFEQAFGVMNDKIIIGLLPSYLERNNSSLVSMVDHFIKLSNNSKSGFYLDEIDELFELIEKSGDGEDIFLFGVSFALLDLAEQYESNLAQITVIETGGMKGRRQEIIKEELYDQLKKRLSLNKIYTEYGMTELLSQALVVEWVLGVDQQNSIKSIRSIQRRCRPGKKFNTFHIKIGRSV
jgi:phenylacetate-coenzyme A ligase PaaK-like adenylate-forming protein